MIEMTPTARERLEAYLARLRSALRGAPHVEPEEVEQNVREHIEIALAAIPAPVGAEHLGVVLDRLGPPERWIGDEERPGWKRIMDRFRSGPEDWRLAYSAFALFLLTILLMPIGGILLLFPAYLLSRAAVSFMAEKGDAIGARKWLIYPPIAMLLAFLAMAVLVAPGAGITAWAIDELGIYRTVDLERHTLPAGRRVQLEAGAVMAAFGLSWLIAAPVLAAAHRPLQIAFMPLLNGWRRRHLAVLALVGAMVSAIGAVVLYTAM